VRYLLAFALGAAACGGPVEAPRFELGIELRPRPEPVTARARLEVAAAFRRAGKLADAKDELDRLAAFDARFPGLARERGLLLEALGEHDDAVAAYRAALKEEPGDAALRLRLGVALVKSGDGKAALPILHALEPAMHTAELRACLALLALWRGEVSAAVAAADEAVALDPRSGLAHWAQAELAGEAGDWPRALEQAQLALDAEPHLHALHAHVARWHEAEGNPALAEQAWGKAIAGDDGVAEWHYHLARLLGARGAAAEGELRAAIERAADTQPEWLWRAHLALGRALRSKDAAAALAAYRAALTLAPPDAPERAEAEQAISELEATPR
jgi:tetratricopeptide (TPR) repeat protein